MKRVRFSTLAIAAVLLLCAAFVFAGGTKEAPKGKAYTIGHIMPGPDPWYQADLDAVTYCAKLVGANVVALNSELKPEKEISNVEDLISRKVDAILLDSMSGDLASQAVKLANNAKVPIVMISSSPPKDGKVVAYVSFDFKKIGEMVGTYISKSHPGAKVAWITGKPGAGIIEAYRDGLVGKLAELNTGAKVVAEQPTDWNREQSMGIMSNWLESKLDFDVAFVNNEDMSGGVVQVMKEKGVLGKIPIVSTGGSTEGLNMIKAGEIEATMAASPAVEGAMAMKITLDYLHGKQVKSYYDLPLMAVTKSNIDQAVTWKIDENVLKLIGWDY
jgi:ribose transport system substrate-binding protein